MKTAKNTNSTAEISSSPRGVQAILLHRSEIYFRYPDILSSYFDEIGERESGEDSIIQCSQKKNGRPYDVPRFDLKEEGMAGPIT